MIISTGKGMAQTMAPIFEAESIVQPELLALTFLKMPITMCHVNICVADSKFHLHVHMITSLLSFLT